MRKKKKRKSTLKYFEVYKRIQSSKYLVVWASELKQTPPSNSKRIVSG